MALMSSSGGSTLRKGPTDPSGRGPRSGGSSGSASFLLAYSSVASWRVSSRTLGSSRTAPKAGSERPATSRCPLTSATTSCPPLETGRSVRQIARSQPSLSILSRQPSRISGASRTAPVRGSTTTGTSHETLPSTRLPRRSGSSEASSRAIFSGMSGAGISPSLTTPALAREAEVDGDRSWRRVRPSPVTATPFPSSQRGLFGLGLEQDLYSVGFLLLEDLVAARALLHEGGEYLVEVQVGAADGRGRHAHHGVGGFPDGWVGHVIHLNVSLAVPRQRLQLVFLGSFACPDRFYPTVLTRHE